MDLAPSDPNLAQPFVGLRGAAAAPSDGCGLCAGEAAGSSEMPVGM